MTIAKMNYLIMKLHVTMQNSLEKKLSEVISLLLCFIGALHATMHVTVKLHCVLTHHGDLWMYLGKLSREAQHFPECLCHYLMCLGPWLDNQVKERLPVISTHSPLFFLVCASKPRPHPQTLLFQDGLCLPKPGAKINPLSLTLFCRVSGHSNIHQLVESILTY